MKHYPLLLRLLARFAKEKKMYYEIFSLIPKEKLNILLKNALLFNVECGYFLQRLSYYKSFHEDSEASKTAYNFLRNDETNKAFASFVRTNYLYEIVHFIQELGVKDDFDRMLTTSSIIDTPTKNFKACCKFYIENPDKYSRFFYAFYWHLDKKLSFRFWDDINYSFTKNIYQLLMNKPYEPPI